MNTQANASSRNPNGPTSQGTAPPSAASTAMFLVAAASVAVAAFFYRQQAERTSRAPQPQVVVPAATPAFSAVSAMQTDGLPSGPSGVFIQLDPPGVSSQRTFQLGTPQGRQALETFLDGELNSVPGAPNQGF